MYNVMLVSGVHHGNSVRFFFRFFSLTGSVFPFSSQFCALFSLSLLPLPSSTLWAPATNYFLSPASLSWRLGSF